MNTITRCKKVASISLAMSIGLLACGLLLYLAALPAVVVGQTAVAFTIDASTLANFEQVETTDGRILLNGEVVVHLTAPDLAAFNAATIRVFTENGVDERDDSLRGLVGETVPTETVSIKLWTPNFGKDEDDLDTIPNPLNDHNWGNYWVYAFNTTDAIIEPWPYDQPLFNQTDLYKWHEDGIEPLPNALNITLPVYITLALEKKASPQTYSTDLIFNFALSDDGGATFTSHRQTVPLNLIVHETAPTITLEAEEVSFQGFNELGTWPQRTLASGHLLLDLQARGLHSFDAATLRLYTQNGTDEEGNPLMGMLGNLSPTRTVPFKVWTPNFGLGHDLNGDKIPDIDNETNWRDNEDSVWLFAFDQTQPITETWWAELPPDHPLTDPNCAWCHPLFNYVDLFKWSDHNDNVDSEFGEYVFHLPNSLLLTDRRPFSGKDRRVPLYFAADLTDAFPQTYSTTLIIEAAFSNEAGETVTVSRTVPITIDATIEGDQSNINWLVNRVRMRPDLDNSTPTIEKLADSYQEQLDWSDAGFVYDQALAIMALTASGHYTDAQHILNGLQYLQNDDGSWFFSYATAATAAQVEQWATTDETTLITDIERNEEGRIIGATCQDDLTVEPNNLPDELEKRVCWNETHDLDLDQLGPWLLDIYTDTKPIQTDTFLPDKIKYRTYDYRKFMGTNAWVNMAIGYYEMQTGDDSYRQMSVDNLAWIEENYLDQDSQSPTFGGVTMGRVWQRNFVTDTLTTTYGFLDWEIYVAEHNFDAYAAFKGMGLITGNEKYHDIAAGIEAFVFRQLWAPNVNIHDHPELNNVAIDNYFFPGINMSDPITPLGTIDSGIYLDGQSWAILAFGANKAVPGVTATSQPLKVALDYVFDHMLVTDQTIYAGTGYEVTGIDGFKENSFDRDLENVWSEGSEGVVMALYLARRQAEAGYYHQETASYTLSNGGVPYTTDPPGNGWTDAPSIAGTAWYYFNELSPPLNPFHYWGAPFRLHLPTVLHHR